jgi:3-methylcrotonyl-CoA carboxylase alpha subunit
LEYKLKCQEETISLQVDAGEDGRFTATIDGNRADVAYGRISDHMIPMTIDGRQKMAFVANTEEGKAVMVDGHTWLFIENNTPLAHRTRGGPKNGDQAITPPMPAVVTKILVAEGDAVGKGQGVIVVSAMKMDTTLSAPFDGVVARINVAEGEKVSPKQILVDIDPSTIEETQTEA